MKQCNCCGRCCEEYDYKIDENDLINWYYDTERDNTHILDRVTVEARLEDDKVWTSYVMTGTVFCEEQYIVGYNYFPTDISMRRYRKSMYNAFDGLGKCWFYDGKRRKCKIHEVAPKVCRQYFCKSGKGTDRRLLTEGGYWVTSPYPHRISEEGLRQKKIRENRYLRRAEEEDF